VPAGTRVEPVVKADAYGHGLLPVARTLAAVGADGLCVATLDEGLVLRRAGLELPILVLYPVPPDSARAAARADLTISAGDPTLLERTLDALGRGAAAARRPLAIALEVETGLGRGGFVGSALISAARLVEEHPAARLASVWSHLSAAEDRPRSASQEDRFRAAAALLAGGGIVLPRGLAASGGLLGGAIDAFDGVRPGLAVYGLVPEEVALGEGPSDVAEAARRLRPVLSLHARPVRVADLAAGTGIGYGPAFTTVRPSRIATLPLGYGDGWPRSSAGVTDVLVRGARVPLVGTVAMDAVMADVTDVPGALVSVDDEFTLLGRQGEAVIGADELARSRTTISWEVVTSMAARLPRVYHARAVPVGIRTLTVERFRWPASSSGTATSANSRSTPS
jgi:alanine racemase